MAELPQLLLKASLVVFMVGNLLDMGLRLDVERALHGLRDVRFVAQGVVWGFVLCPAVAWALAAAVPMAPPYATGLVVLGMAPCAPFLPMVVDRARGDPSYAAVFMLLASVVTVAFVPVALPILVRGASVGAWAIAKPLVVLLLVPLAAGIGLRRARAPVARRIEPWVRKATGVDTVVLLALCVILYAGDFVAAIGSYAIGTQILFFSVVTFAPYALAVGLPRGRRSVLALGLSTRNLGAAFAPLFAMPDVDRRATAMIAIAVPMQVLFSFAAARLFARHGGAAAGVAAELRGPAPGGRAAR